MLCCPLQRAVTYSCMTYIVVALVAIVVWAQSVETAAKYNCHYTVKCSFVYDKDWPWCNTNQVYTDCTYPSVGGDLYFSYWGGNDCMKGDDCRAFKSIQQCVNYIHPRKDNDDCNQKGTTIESAVRDLAWQLSWMVSLTLVPALGLAIRASFQNELAGYHREAELVGYHHELVGYHHEPSVAQAFT